MINPCSKERLDQLLFYPSTNDHTPALEIAKITKEITHFALEKAFTFSFLPLQAVISNGNSGGNDARKAFYAAQNAEELKSAYQQLLRSTEKKASSKLDEAELKNLLEFENSVSIALNLLGIDESVNTAALNGKYQKQTIDQKPLNIASEEAHLFITIDKLAELVEKRVEPLVKEHPAFSLVHYLGKIDQEDSITQNAKRVEVAVVSFYNHALSAGIKIIMESAKIISELEKLEQRLQLVGITSKIKSKPANEIFKSVIIDRFGEYHSCKTSMLEGHASTKA